MENVSQFEVHTKRGFLPALDPLERLPYAFDEWEELASNTTSLLESKEFQKEARSLSKVQLDSLQNRPQIERAMLLLSIFGATYVWSAEEPTTTLPSSLAVPWCHVAATLGRPPIISYASINLNNWRRKNRSGFLELENLEALQLIGGTEDEQWFYLIPVAIEARGATALQAILSARRAVERNDPIKLIEDLQTVEHVVSDLTKILLRTKEKCDPYIFYHRIRPFLSGWPSPGIIYGGVSTNPINFSGASAAQSSLFQAIDAGLGITHDNPNTSPFLLGMRKHMPPKHRSFIEMLEKTMLIRDKVLSTQRHELLIEQYNLTLSSIESFRFAHLEIATRYITKESPKPKKAKGTGGTEFTPFLINTRKETTNKLL